MTPKHIQNWIENTTWKIRKDEEGKEIILFDSPESKNRDLKNILDFYYTLGSLYKLHKRRDN